MTITFNLPAYFKKERMFDLVKADGFSYVEYRQYKEKGINELLLTSYMFVVIINGSKTIHTDGRSHVISPGQAFFAKKGSYLVSERLSSETGSFESLIFFFEDRFLFDFIQRNINKSLNVMGSSPRHEAGVFPLAMSPLLKSGIEGVLPYFTKESPITRSILKLKFEEILLTLLDADDTLEFHTYLYHLNQDHKKDLTDSVETNLVKNLTIDELARLSGRSLTTFKRDFQGVFGESPRAWINQKRMERAYTLLKVSGRNVTDVCYETGFSSLSHFIKLFKSTYGMTPKQFQKDQMDQNSDRMR